MIDSDCSHGLVAVGIGSRECPLGGVVEVMMKTCLDEGVIRICGGSAPGYFIFDVAGVLVFQGPRRDEGFVEALEKALREVNDAK
ncbi:MAG: hypothetical protein EOP88_08890 [Verrucomicrobiaceae bacterium]|nr:MAG: hypothetical protein EOP88_08890 [Verrucomicrobiaceae bacterium]